ncbi:MAG: glycerol-3-phosphate dehydrogenase/oxidase [Verrucomicrobiota bacterium]
MPKHEDRLEKLQSIPNPQTLIVGGGINGAGLFRELSLRGVSVTLIDKSDYAAGASCATSRMVHGGLRYLENGEFDLVSESLAERNRLLANAPHAVFPMPTNIPIYTRWSGLFNSAASFFRLKAKPAQRGSLIIKIGLSFYDFLTRKRSPMPPHDFRSREKALKRFPSLNPKIISSSRYYDAWVPNPERLCLELIKDGVAASPNAQALNYVSLSGIRDGQLILTDELTENKISIRPQILVNATGAWIDLTNQSLNRKTEHIGGTKGSHLILEAPKLRAELGDEMFFYETADNRICILIPYSRTQLLLGTTDIRIDNPEEAVCSQEEINYLLTAANDLFPKANLREEQIVATFSGVRPLPKSDGTHAGRISRSQSSPVHQATTNIPFETYNLVGGKWTTFRSFSEQVCDSILAKLALPRISPTTDIPIGGGRDFHSITPKSIAAQTEIPILRAQALHSRYGSAALEFAKRENADTPELIPGYTSPEIEYIIESEQVQHLLDLILRRTRIAFSGKLTRATLSRIALLHPKFPTQTTETIDYLNAKHHLKI